MRHLSGLLCLALAFGPAVSFAQTPPPVVSSPVAAPAAAPATPAPVEAQAASPNSSSTTAPTPAPNPVPNPVPAAQATPPAQPVAPAPTPVAPAEPAQAAPVSPTQPPIQPPIQPPAQAPSPTADASRSTLAPGLADPTDVQEVELSAKPAAILSGTSTWDDAFETLKSTFKTIEDELAKAGMRPAGRPVTIFVHTDDNGFKFDAMIPVSEVPNGKTELTPTIKFGKTPDGKAYRFLHKEAYEEIDGTYETITAYLDAKDIVAKDAFIEEYVSDLTDANDVNLTVNIYVQPKN